MIRSVLSSLWRRWYITFPGLLLAGLLAVGAWLVVPPTYERTASEYLVPGSGSMPDNANPFLYLNGLTQASDVLVRAVGSNNVVDEIQRSYPGADVQVVRDPSTAGPVILITVNARSDADAAEIINILLKRSQTEMADLQAGSSVKSSDLITVRPLTIDQHGTMRPRTRLAATAGALAAGVILAVLLAALVDGLVGRWPRKRAKRLAPAEVFVPAPDSPDPLLDTDSDPLLETDADLLLETDADPRQESDREVSDVVDADEGASLPARVPG